MTEYCGLFFHLLFSQLLLLCGNENIYSCACRTCGLECYGYWIFRRLAVFYNADMNLDILFRTCGRESLCQSKFTKSLSLSKIIPLRTQNYDSSEAIWAFYKRNIISKGIWSTMSSTVISNKGYLLTLCPLHEFIDCFVENMWRRSATAGKKDSKMFSHGYPW